MDKLTSGQGDKLTRRQGDKWTSGRVDKVMGLSSCAELSLCHLSHTKRAVSPTIIRRVLQNANYAGCALIAPSGRVFKIASKSRAFFAYSIYAFDH